MYFCMFFFSIAAGPLIIKGRGFDRGDLNNHVWSKLEEIVTSRILHLPVFTSQLQCFTNTTNNVYKPNAIVGGKFIRNF